MLSNSLTPSVVESVTITLIEFVIVYILHAPAYINYSDIYMMLAAIL